MVSKSVDSATDSVFFLFKGVFFPLTVPPVTRFGEAFRAADFVAVVPLVVGESAVSLESLRSFVPI